MEHETDEVLGTGSCAFDADPSTQWCTDNNVFKPADLFRYHSNGARSLAPGTNDSCSSPSSLNACFTIDGASFLKQYNNVVNGADAGDWVRNCAAPLVQDAISCPAVAFVDISPQAEIKALNPSLTLPNTAITVVHRSDSSGTTAGFTGFLAAVDPEWASKVGEGKTVPWPTGTGAKGNAGVAVTLRAD